MMVEFELMMKCDMCYDRTSVGKKPMCATVCPSGALFYGSREEVEQLRPRSTPVDHFLFGGQAINTRVNILAPRAAPPERVDILSALNEPPLGQAMELNLLWWSVTLEFSGGTALQSRPTRKLGSGRPLGTCGETRCWNHVTPSNAPWPPTGGPPRPSPPGGETFPWTGRKTSTWAAANSPSSWC